jgi:hypothetical protein
VDDSPQPVNARDAALETLDWATKTAANYGYAGASATDMLLARLIATLEQTDSRSEINRLVGAVESVASAVADRRQ